MKRMLTSIACLLMLVTASAQEQKKSAPAKSARMENGAAAKVLEGKVRKAWEDYQKKDKKAFAAILADDFETMSNEAEGPIGKDTELAEMEKFNVAKYELKDFKMRPAGKGAAVMTYRVEYSGTYENEPIKMKALYGEVWVQMGGAWKLLWEQETKLK
ncbi:MAG: hypothetical protein JWQ87_3645 [Candidatus Sulfotelmatobacter sp.]|nr:hypothetical protein [Candidatus Sulfotelmatobacter sp.]